MRSPTPIDPEKLVNGFVKWSMICVIVFAAIGAVYFYFNPKSQNLSPTSHPAVGTKSP
jgi:hypothetical protein